MRHPILALLVLLLPASAVQAQDGAQKLFEAMEQKLAKAKAHKIAYESDGKEGDRPHQLKGVLILATGNRFKWTFEGKDNSRAVNGVVVSDGKMQVRKTESDNKPLQWGAPHERFFEFFVGHLGRVGVHAGYEALRGDDPLNPAKLKLSGFKMAGKEKVGSREANALEYQLMLPGDDKIKATCKLWLDVQTTLPVKRILEINWDGKVAFRSVETYGDWELDPQLPDETFALPK